MFLFMKLSAQFLKFCFETKTVTQIQDWTKEPFIRGSYSAPSLNSAGCRQALGKVKEAHHKQQVVCSVSIPLS